MSTPKGPTQNVTITQQSLNLLRQIVAAVGWAKTLPDMYIGGMLLEEVLPSLDSLDWLKTKEQIAALNPEDLKAYQDKDKEWTSKPVTFVLTARQVEAIKKAFTTMVETGQLGPAPYLTELIKTFSLVAEIE